jgi:hypothetical protein
VGVGVGSRRGDGDAPLQERSCRGCRNAAVEAQLWEAIRQRAVCACVGAGRKRGFSTRAARDAGYSERAREGDFGERDGGGAARGAGYPWWRARAPACAGRAARDEGRAARDEGRAARDEGRAVRDEGRAAREGADGGRVCVSQCGRVRVGVDSRAPTAVEAVGAQL